MVDFLETVLKEVEGTADKWSERVAERDQITVAPDPVTDTLRYCAADLVERLREIHAQYDLLTVPQYAEVHGLSPATVRNWIRRDELTAFDSAKGKMVARRSRRQRHSIEGK